jgi:hypothetical protein
MNARALANSSIRKLYIVSAVSIAIVVGRLFFDFTPRIDISPETKPDVRAPFLAVPNIGPIARENWLGKTLRSCLSFTSAEMSQTISNCSDNYFDVRSQSSFEGALPKTSFGRYMTENPSSTAEVQAVNTVGPFLIYQGTRSGLPVWRYQTEVMTTLFLPGRTATKKWMVDITMTFDVPDGLYFSGFRYLSFFMKERS